MNRSHCGQIYIQQLLKYSVLDNIQITKNNTQNPKLIAVTTRHKYMQAIKYHSFIQKTTGIQQRYHIDITYKQTQQVCDIYDIKDSRI